MRSILFILSIVLSISLNAQKLKYVSSAWTGNTGEDPEPSSLDYSSHAKGNFGYCLLNNNEHIYFFLKTGDHALKTNILKNGMTLWIDMDNQSLRKMGIKYPLGNTRKKKQSIPGIPEEREIASLTIEDLIANANTIELTGFAGEEIRKFAADNYDNFRGTINNSGGNFYYMMRMPSVKLPLRNSKDGVGAMPFSIGIEIFTGTDKDPKTYWIKNVKLSTGR